MAKSEIVRLLTFNKAQRYLADQGLTLSTQQIRNLARTNDVVMAGVSEYTDPITDSTAKVIEAGALDRYLTWRHDNPETVGRSGRVASPIREARIQIDVSQLDALNAVLTANGFTEAAFPVRKPRAPKVASDAPSTNGFEDVSSDVDLSELELIEVA